MGESLSRSACFDSSDVAFYSSLLIVVTDTKVFDNHVLPALTSGNLFEVESV
jgi:hypothetical protein